MALLPAATRAAAAGLCRIAASASSSPPSSAPARRERELPLALLAERGKMVVGGHRGMGMNAVGAPPGARVGAARERENTLLSFGRAAAHAAVAFVEFDVQVTKDGCPIIFHDDFILTQGIGAVYERRVTDLLLEEFLSYGPQKESRKVSKPLLRRTGDGRVLNWSTEEDDSLCTLQEVFECVSPHLGFNIELKFDDNVLHHKKDLERALQAILQVLFLTEGGTSKHHDSRRNSLNNAIQVCLEHDLHGIVSDVRGILKNPAAVVRAQESNLALLTYGQLNNVWEAVYVQYLMGINGVIVDQVEEISNAVAGFSKPDLNRSSAGVDGATHQAFSQQQLGFLLRLIPELIEQRH
uniref:glycerophosphodiester phosphodiesterase n=1 Tax=Setaria italica TaxID=4555 RepID=K3YID5_SETIT